MGVRLEGVRDAQVACDLLHLKQVGFRIRNGGLVTNRCVGQWCRAQLCLTTRALVMMFLTVVLAM